jgi:hypothetical protein
MSWRRHHSDFLDDLQGDLELGESLQSALLLVAQSEKSPMHNANRQYLQKSDLRWFHINGLHYLHVMFII